MLLAWDLAYQEESPVRLRRNHESTSRRLAALHECSRRETDKRQTDNTVTIPTHWLASHESAKTVKISCTYLKGSGKGRRIIEGEASRSLPTSLTWPFKIGLVVRVLLLTREQRD